MKKINPNGSKTLYVGGIYEVDKASGGSIQRTVTYYPVAGAMRINSTLYYTLKDHLGSASVVTDATGVTLGEQRYYPYGETRVTTGTIYTDRLFTGQREMAGLGIYHYNARFYSPKLGRFLSPDTIIPEFANPQSWNRFSYVINNPIRYNDPTGHCYGPVIVICGGIALVAVAITAYVYTTPQMQQARQDASEYISKNVLNRVEKFEENVANTNSGRNFPKNPCTTSINAMRYCVLTVGTGLGLALIARTTGGCGEPESNSTCPPTNQLTPTPSPTATLTPTNTAPSTPSCPPFIQCPNTSTPAPNNTSTSTSTPPINIPAPPNQLIRIPI